MAKPARNSDTVMYFVTTATQARQPLFEVSRMAELFIETLLQYRREGRFKLHAYLVLPDHVHLLMTPQTLPLAATVALIKDGFAGRLHSAQTVWDSKFTAHPIPSLRALESLRTYLHGVPVRAKITLTPELYPYSSAHRSA